MGTSVNRSPRCMKLDPEQVYHKYFCYSANFLACEKSISLRWTLSERFSRRTLRKRDATNLFSTIQKQYKLLRDRSDKQKIPADCRTFWSRLLTRLIDGHNRITCLQVKLLKNDGRSILDFSTTRQIFSWLSDEIIKVTLSATF